MIQSYTAIFIFLFTSLFLFSQQNINTSSYSFTKNQGQIFDQNYQSNPDVLYLLNMPGFNVQLKENGFSYDIYEIETLKEKNPMLDISAKYAESEKIHKYNFHRVDFEFLNPNQNFEKLEIEAVEGVENYYLEHIPDGVLNVKSYKKIVYKNFYNNIDLEFITRNDSIKPFEYNFILHPSAKLEDIKFRINGAESILDKGSININVKFGVLKETIPASWFEGNESENTELFFQSFGNNVYGLESKIDIDENLKKSTLIIDPVPVRLWGTYYGVNGTFTYSFIYSLKYYDSALYSGGSAVANGFATSGTFQTTFNGGTDGVLTKFSEDGQRIWATYCGSSNLEYISDLDFDQNGDIYVAGTQLNGTSNLSTSGTHQPIKDNFNDGFIIKFNSIGQRVWGTYFGGEQNDYLTSIVVNNTNASLYVAGYTNSGTGISTAGSHQPNLGGPAGHNDSGYFAQFDLYGNRIWSSYYGGSNADGIYDIELDLDYNIIIGGIANSSNNISTLNNYFGGLGDSFLAKFTSNGNRIWGMYVGGDKSDYMTAIDVNSSNDIAIVGYTTSSNLATNGVFLETYYTTGAFQEYSGFIVNVNSAGQKLWGTYCGGYYVTWATDVKFNQANEIIITGRTRSSTHIASENGYDITLGGLSNAYLLKFNESGQRIWGTYYGGNFGVGYGYSLDLNQDYIYLAGSSTFEYGIGTPGTYQPNIPFNDYNAFIAKFKDCEANTMLEMVGNHCEGDDFTLIVSGGISYEWYGPNGYIGNGNTVSIENFDESDAGEYFVFVENGDCSEVKSILVEFAGEEPPIPDIPTIHAICSVTLTPPTATDDCLGEMTATTENPLQYDIPGTYWVTWMFLDNFGNYIYQDQQIILESGDDFMNESVDFTLCETETNFDLTLIEPDLTESTVENITFTYYESMEDMVNNNPIPNPENYTNPNNLTQLYVKGTVDDCSDYTIIQIELIPQPIANSITPVICDNDEDGFGQMILNNYFDQISPQENVNITFFEDSSFTIPIDSNTEITVSEGETIYVIVASGNCENQSTITIELGDYTLNPISDFEVCVDNADTPHNFDLTEKSEEIALFFGVNANQINYYFSLNDARNASSPLNFIYQNQTNPQTIYASFSNSTGCPDIVSFLLIVNQNPIWDQQENYQKCEDSPIELMAPEGYTYLWSTGETTSQITIMEEGTYSVQITGEHCTIEKNILVENFSLILFDYNYENGIFQMIPDSNLLLEYSLDGIFWQQSPHFYNLQLNQEYEIWIRTESGCLQKETIFVYDKLPNLISPNGDGKNDYWDVSFLRNVLDIRIFDRYGKSIYEVYGDNLQPWDGRYLGRKLPSGNYWYIIRFKTNQKINGSIYLKNY